MSIDTTSPSAQLRGRAVAFALVARSLGRDPSPLRDAQHVDALREAVERAGGSRAGALVDRIDPVAAPSLEALAGSWVRWFDLGRVAPYEGSNVAASAGGVTPRLADVAGYYRAFGMRVPGDRPDHVVAELEFLAFVLLLEADAVERGHDEHAGIAAAAARSFLRDHIGTWIDAWAARVEAVDELAPWAPIATAAAELVRAEAARHNVVPARTAAVLVADADAGEADHAVLDCD
jgi:nitrate reductase assembly molybdenum cofactor insertion protein NarJ